LICFEPQKKHFLCSKPLTPLKALQHKAYSDSWLLFCPIRQLYQSVKAGDVKEAVIATASIIPPVGKLKKSKKFYKIVKFSM